MQKLMSLISQTEIIEKIIGKIKVGKSYKDYEDLEFELLHFNNATSDIEGVIGSEDLDLEIEKNKKFNEIRPLEKSDTATEKKVEAIMQDALYISRKNELFLKTLLKKQKGYLRIADHINSSFIKDMADAKRQALVESLPSNQ